MIKLIMADLLKIVIVFCLMLFLLRKKVAIGYVMLVTSATLFFLYTMSLNAIIQTIKSAAADGITIKLLLSLSLIRIFEMILREHEMLATMMNFAKSSFASRKAVIISMPMLIGMLPSLGGAFFSAPMVKEATSGTKMSNDEKAFINYWFRHPWEYILPLYPGIVLASAISNIELYKLITVNTVYAVLLLLTGFIFSMRNIGKITAIKNGYSAVNETENPEYKRQLISFLPIAAVLLSVVFMHLELHYALLMTIIPMLIMYKYNSKKILRLIKYGFSTDVLIMIFGTMLFKETMESSGAVAKLSSFFVAQGIPIMPLACLLPFLSGFLTGLTVGFVGSTFPILISMADPTLPFISLAFAAGFAGVLLSPVHLCLVLTREYFNADIKGMYKRMIPATGIIFTTAIVLYYTLK